MQQPVGDAADHRPEPAVAVGPDGDLVGVVDLRDLDELLGGRAADELVLEGDAGNRDRRSQELVQDGAAVELVLLEMVLVVRGAEEGGGSSKAYTSTTRPLAPARRMA